MAKSDKNLTKTAETSAQIAAVVTATRCRSCDKPLPDAKDHASISREGKVTCHDCLKAQTSMVPVAAQTTDAVKVEESKGARGKVRSTKKTTVAVPDAMPAVAAEATDTGGDAAVAKLPVPKRKGPGNPWDKLPRPVWQPGQLGAMRFHSIGDGSTPNTVAGTEVECPNGTRWPVADNGMQGFAIQAHFPGDFMYRLDNPTRATVINERVRKEDPGSERTVTLTVEGGAVTGVTPGRRELIAAPDLFDFAVDFLAKDQGIKPTDNEPYEVIRTRNETILRLVTDREQPLTRSVGDMLGMGFEISQDYVEGISIGLFVRRLICLNGAVGTRKFHVWRGSAGLTRDAQFDSVKASLRAGSLDFANFIARADDMVSRRVANPEAALRERVRSMGLAATWNDQIVEAWREQPGQTENNDTEWDLINAVTYAVRSGRIPDSHRLRFTRAAGAWTEGFRLVNAEMPERVARRVGASIRGVVE